MLLLQQRDRFRRPEIGHILIKEHDVRLQLSHQGCGLPHVRGLQGFPSGEPLDEVGGAATVADAGERVGAAEELGCPGTQQVHGPRLLLTIPHHPFR